MADLTNLSQSRNMFHAFFSKIFVTPKMERVSKFLFDLTILLDRNESAHVFVQHSAGPSNGYAPRFLGFSLFVSNTTNRLDGVLCFKDTDFNISTIPSVFNTTCTVHGQYVIYYNERLEGVTYPDDYSLEAYNGICEVEVYGLYRYSLNIV